MAALCACCSVTQMCNLMNCSVPTFPVLHCLPEVVVYFLVTGKLVLELRMR